MDSLKTIRHKIDKIDAKILKLLRQRKTLVVEAGKLKQKSKKAITDRAREGEILSRALGSYESAILGKIISESKKVQREL